MKIQNVHRTKKPKGKTLYVTFESEVSASQIFKRNAMVENEDF